MLIPAPHVYYADTEHGVALLDTRRGTWHMLDQDAARIWHAVTVRGGTEGLADEIALPAGQDPHAVDTAIRTFTARLCERGLLTDTGPSTAHRTRRWRYRP